MSVGIEVTIDDLGAALVLNRIELGMVDTTPLMDAIGAALVSGTVRRFAAASGPDGTPWTPSLRATLGQRGGPTLTDRGHLRDSITHEVVAPDAVRVGSNLPYARIHQLGGEIRAKAGKALRFTLANGETAMVEKVVMPARPYLGIDDEDTEKVQDVAVAFINGLVRGIGRAP